MISTLIVIVVFIALFHAVYENIVLPAIQMQLRNELFVLRDRIRTIMIDEQVDAHDQAFLFVHDGINKFLNRLPDMKISLKADIKRESEKNPGLHKDTERRIELIYSSNNAQLVEIFNDTSWVIGKALVANAGGWLIYLLPIALLLASIKNLANLVKELIAMPTFYTEKLIPLHKQR